MVKKKMRQAVEIPRGWGGPMSQAGSSDRGEASRRIRP